MIMGFLRCAGLMLILIQANFAPDPLFVSLLVTLLAAGIFAFGKKFHYILGRVVRIILGREKRSKQQTP